MKIIISSPSLDPKVNVSGISSVTQFIISKNNEVEYIHFEVGRKDTESQSTVSRIKRILHNRNEWKELLRNNKDAVIHYNIPLMRAAIIRDYMLIKVAHNLNLPIVLHVHGGNYIKERNRPWYIKKLLNRIFSWSKHIIVLGDEEKLILEEDFGLKNVVSLPNCIDLSAARTFKRDNTGKKILDILYLGRIEPNKGIDYIFDACKKLKEQGVKLNIHFAGKEEVEGQYIPKFTEEFGEQFIYHGVVSGSKKTEVLKKCDIFLLPSFFEGLPIALLETMSFGQVPVVTAVGSIPTIVYDNNNGLLVNVRNSESIVESIHKLIENDELRAKLSEEAQRTIHTRFDDSSYINSLNKLYKII